MQSSQTKVCGGETRDQAIKASIACITLYQVPPIQASCMHELAFTCIHEEIAQFYLTNAENLTHQFKCDKHINVSYVKSCSNAQLVT